jgi:hypothetical protein
MGLKCSLLGCEYGPVETENDHERRGDEIVITVREVRHCERCGDEQVITENKEVTAVEDHTADDTASPETAAPTDADGATPSDGATADTPMATTETTDTATATGDTSGQRFGDEWGSSPGLADGPASHIEAVDEDDTPEDDAVILGDETDTDGATEPEPAGEASAATAASGEPATDTATSDAADREPLAEPTDSTATTGDAAAADTAGDTDADTGGELLDTDDTTDGFEGSLDEPDIDTIPDTEGDGPDDEGGVPADEKEDVELMGEAADTGAAPDPERTTGLDDLPPGEIEYYCPDCGHSEVAVDSSLRVGDLCPACHAYVERRSRNG